MPLLPAPRRGQEGESAEFVLEMESKYLNASQFSCTKTWESTIHGYIVDMQYLPRAKRLVVGCMDGQVLLLAPFFTKSDVQTEDENGNEANDNSGANSPVRVIWRHPHEVEKVASFEGEDGSIIIVSANAIGQISLLEAPSHEVDFVSVTQWAHAGHVTSLATNGHVVASASHEGRCTLWDKRLKKMATQLGTHTNNASGEIFTAMAFSPSLPVLAVGTSNGVAKLFDMRNLGKPLTQEQQFGDAVARISWHPTLQTVLAVGCDDTKVYVACPEQNRLIYRADVHQDKVKALCWNSVHQNELVSAGWDHLAVRHQVPLE